MAIGDRLTDLSATQYRTARVRMEDGRVARVRVPKNATPEQAVQIARQVVPKTKPQTQQREKPTSFWQGVGEGLQKPVTNALRMAEQIAIPGAGLARAFGINTPVAAAADDVDTWAERKSAQSPYRGSTMGRITGGVIGTLPTAMIPGGPVAQGAASGLLMTPDMENLPTVARDMAIGGVMGKVGDVAGKAIGRGVSRAVGGRQATQALRAAPRKPVTAKAQAYDDAVKVLADNDVLMTPGMRAGGMGRRMEDAADSIPWLRDVTPIGPAKDGALVDMNRAAYNQVLKPLGITLNRNVTPGREALQGLDEAVSMAYEKAAAPLRLQMDDGLVAQLSSYTDDAAARMGPDDATQLSANIEKFISWRQRPEPLKGSEVTRTLADMRKVASNARAQNKQELADTLWAMHDDIEEAAMSQSPKGAVEPFRKAREAVRRMRILEDAGAKTNDGLVTPGAFKAATHRLGYGTTRNRLTRGEAPMQEFADAASVVLPDRLGNSGTAERAGLLSLISGGSLFGAGSVAGLPLPAAGLLGLGAQAYRPSVNSLLQSGRSIPAGRVNAGELIARNVPAMGSAGRGLLSVAGLYPFLSEELEPLP